MSAYNTREHNDAMFAAVDALVDRAGDADIPSGTALPYAVVYPVGPSEIDGPISDPDVDSFPVTQVTCCGQTREQADWLRDKVRQGLLGTYLTVAGRKVGPIRLHTELPARRDTTVTPFIFAAIDQYSAFSTPE